MNDSLVKFISENPLKNTPVEQQILQIHRTGLFLGVSDTPDEKTNWCSWQNYFVAIRCRFKNHEWEPDQISFYKDDIRVKEWLSDQLTIYSTE